MNYSILIIAFEKFAALVGFSSVFCVAFSSALAAYQRVQPNITDKGFSVNFCSVFSASIPFFTIGMVAGYLTGASRAPAVAAVIPALLTFIGGFTIYLVARERRSAATANSAILGLSTMLLLGSLIGSLDRRLHESFQLSLAKKQKEVEIEFAIEQYRKGLGLTSKRGESSEATN